MQVGYRHDIDGLRAIAVLGVVLYHYGLAPLGAGFAGVDVFFVISGFLIGGIILDERAAGTFRFRAFYARRARRILPALLVMLLLVVPVAAVVMSPNELRYYGGGALSALLFVSNLWFYARIDYFNPGAALDPLVHTWSLGVEEQFYLVVPVLLLWLGAGRRWLTWAVVGLISAASLSLMLVHHASYPSAVFYMIQYRAWELGAGVLGALLLRDKAASAVAAQAAWLAPLGLACVVGGLVFIPGADGWPGVWTPVPVAGTWMVLVSGGRPGIATAILAWRPLAWIGLISYSLYLYHQPLHSLTVLALRQEALTLAARLTLLAGSVAIAALSWRLVEQPCRRGALARRGNRRLLWAVAATLVAFAVGGHVTEGYPQRMPDAAQAAIRFEDSEPPTYRRCAGRRLDGDRLDPGDACTHGAEGVTASIAIWGDSHAASIAQPLGLALAPHGLAVKEFSLGGCPPIPDVINVLQMTNTTARKSENCSEYVAGVRDHILADPGLRTVVLYAYWNNYTERRDFDAGNGRVKTDKLYSIPVGAPADLEESARLAALTENLATAVDALLTAGKQVLIVYPLPEAPFEVPQTYAWALWKGRVTEADTAIPRAAFDDYSASSRRMLDSLGERPGLHRIDFSARLCPTAARCELVDAGGDVLFRDANHLSLPGSARVVPDLARRVAEIAAEGADADP